MSYGGRMKDNTLTRHHIIPRSRGGYSEKENFATVTHGEHDKYHQLFQNKTPVEILHYLVTYFWNGQTEHLSTYLDDLEDE